MHDVIIFTIVVGYGAAMFALGWYNANKERSND